LVTGLRWTTGEALFRLRGSKRESQLQIAAFGVQLDDSQVFQVRHLHGMTPATADDAAK
jgi:hypothetical protein